MTEISIESSPIETIIQIEGGPTLTTTVEQEIQTLVETPSAPVIVDLFSGARGEPGSAFFSGPAFPSIYQGVLGDVYVVTEGATAIGEVFVKTLVTVPDEDSPEPGATKTVTVWQPRGSIRGPAGTVNTVNGHGGPDVILDKVDIGLGLAENTTDLNKPVSIATQTALDAKISNGAILKKTDPFWSGPKVYLPELHNGLYRAADRFEVEGTFRNISDDSVVGPIPNPRIMFDGDYDNALNIPSGQYVLITITFPDEANEVFPGYPYGDFIVSSYYIESPAEVTARFYTTYAPQGGPVWKTLDPVFLENDGSSVFKFNNSWYGISHMEFKIVSGPNVIGSSQSSVTQIEFAPERPGTSETPVFDKYRPQTIQSTTYWKNSDGVETAYIEPSNGVIGGNGSALTHLNASNITGGILDDIRLSSNVALLNSSQTITGTKTFSVAPSVPDNSWSIGKTSGLSSALDGKQSVIAAGTTSQYWRGDKTWQDINTAAVDLSSAQSVGGAKTFTSSPVVPTPTADTQAAHKKYVDDRINATIDAAPGALDTLNELAAALGDDPNFATTITNTVATKEPNIAAGTTAQYWRGDKSWQTLNPAAVGLGNVNNVAHVEIAGTQTVTGVKNFTAGISATGADFSSLGVKPVGDHGYIQFFSRDAAPTTRTAFVGVGSPGATSFHIYNEMAGGNVVLVPGSGGLVAASSDLDVSGVIYGNGAGIVAIQASNIGSGTLSDARLSSNVGLLTGTQTFSGLKTFSAGIIVSGNASATTFSGNGASLTSLNGSNISTGTVSQARLVQNVVRVYHGATAGLARPTGSTYVEWVGSVVPTNMAAGDTWLSTESSPLSLTNPLVASIVTSASSATDAPSGWYWCEGQEIPISSDTALYNALTNTATVFPYGANTNGSGAAGSTHFRIPDLKGRVPTGLKGSGSMATIGQTGGAETHTLTQSEMPNHTHASSAVGFGSTGSTTNVNFGSVTDWRADQSTLGVVGASGGPHNNLQPYVTLRYMIKR